MTGSIRTVSNALSFLRILLVVPISLFIMRDTPGGRTVAMVLILVAAATDFLDGYVARKKDEVTELGKILDPVADKIAVGVVALILAVQGRVPGWFLAAVVARDLLILAGGWYLSRKRSLIMQSNRLGKWTAAALALTLFAAVAETGAGGPVLMILMAVSLVMIAASSASYGVRFFSSVYGSGAANP